MKSRGSAVSWVVVLMAACSLLTMVCLFQIDRIVHNDLYRYGLQFSYQWAVPYWTMARIGFAMGWVNIIAAIGIQLYTVAFRRKEVEQLVTDVEKEISRLETMPAHKVEEQKSQEPKLTESVEKAKDTMVSTTKLETPEKKEEQTAIEDTSSQGKGESKQPEEVKKPQETEPTTEQKETKSESPEKNEENPILAGISQQELSPTVEETQQQATPSAS